MADKASHEARPDGDRIAEGAARAPLPQDVGPSVATMLQLQRTIGNHATTAIMRRSNGPLTAARTPRLMVQRGVKEALGRGYDMYARLNDVGAPFARELMRWRLTGLGQMFIKRGAADPDWNDFMLGRPELHRALLPVFRQIAEEEAKAGPTGNRWLGGYRNISKDITNVQLNELESMRLTLHGCHRIEIRGRVHVEQDGADSIVRIYPQMTWVDVADLHPGTTTELAGGAEVDDSEFTAAGWDYDIRIMFAPIGSILAPESSSQWHVSSSGVTHDAGWPPEGSVPQGGRRS